MTEQERMKAGYMWLDDEENMALQDRARALVEKFNNLPADANKERHDLCKEMFGQCGDHTWIVPPFKITTGVYTSIGDGCYFNMGATLIDDWKITIGNHVMFGPNVTVCTTGHAISPKHRGDGMYSFPITIKDGAWLGANVVVMPGVTIGENSVIGAGSVVTKDIPDNVVAFGVPCKVYRQINECDEEYYFGDHRFDEQPVREEADMPHLDFLED